MTRRLNLTRLESRLAPANAIWDGGGTDNLWSTAANWVGDVAPQAILEWVEIPAGIEAVAEEKPAEKVEKPAEEKAEAAKA